MKVIILAAGIGSRLKPITNEKPKCLVKVSGKSILEYQLFGLTESGVRQEDINVVVGYKKDMIKNHLKEQFNEVNIIVNDDFLSTNNMYSLYLALKKININDEQVIICNGDCIYDFKILHNIVKDYENNLIAAQKSEYLEESMKIIFNENKIIKISKQIKKDVAYGNSIDLYKLTNSSIKNLKKIIDFFIETKKDLNSWTEVALDKLLDTDNFIPYDIKNDKWIEIDNYNDLILADQIFSKFDLSKKKCIILDLDGTTYLGDIPIEGTINFIKKNWEKFDFKFITNNTSNTPLYYLNKLKKFGIDIKLENIITPLNPLINYINEKELSKIFFVLNDQVIEFIKQNIENYINNFNDDECQAVVVGYDTDLTYAKLRRVSNLLNNKPDLSYLATHKDLVCPTQLGPIPDSGSIIKILEIATNRKPNIIFGKPNRVLIYQIFEKYNPDEILFVGDRIYTDKKFANDLNIDFVLVLSGETKREEVEELDKFPELIVNSLGDLI